jgi:uncharacterized protein (TIGR02996 family)
VTTEDDFQRALDAAPDDWDTRLALADFFHARGDPRAEGYRALGLLRMCPYVDRVSYWWTTIKVSCCPVSGVRGNGCSLPRDWFRLVDLDPHDESFKPLGSEGVARSRRAVEDAAALAFGKLPAQRQAQLLARAFASPNGRRARRVR